MQDLLEELRNLIASLRHVRETVGILTEMSSKGVLESDTALAIYLMAKIDREMAHINRRVREVLPMLPPDHVEKLRREIDSINIPPI